MSNGMNTVSKIRPVRVCSTGEQSAALVFVALVFLLIAGCIVPGLLDGDRRAAVESLQVTATAEALLTETHKTEISRTIENLEIQWHSLEAHTNPGIQAEVATGPFLKCYGNARFGEAIYDEPFWLVATSAKVKNVRVLEYSSERFKAIASVARQVNKMTPDGVILESSLPAGRCGIYVFLREDDVWKLSGFFLTNPPLDDVVRDWHNAPDWLREIIGGLPEGELCDWK
jgi:hypothetical protein